MHRTALAPRLATSLLTLGLIGASLACDPGPQWKVEDDFTRAPEGTAYVPGTSLQLTAYLDEGFRGDKGLFFEPPDVAVSQDRDVFVVDGEPWRDGESVVIPIRTTGPGEAMLELRYEGEGGELAAVHKVRVRHAERGVLTYWDAPSREAGQDPLVIDGDLAPLVRGVHELVVAYRVNDEALLGRGALEVQGPAWVQALGASGSDDDAVVLAPVVDGAPQTLVLATGGRAFRQVDVVPATIDDADQVTLAPLRTDVGARQVLRAEVTDSAGRALLGANCSWWLDGQPAGQGDGVGYYATGGATQRLDVKCGGAEASMEVATERVDMLVTNPVPTYDCDLDGSVLDDTLLEEGLEGLGDLIGC